MFKRRKNTRTKLGNSANFIICVYACFHRVFAAPLTTSTCSENASNQTSEWGLWVSWWRRLGQSPRLNPWARAFCGERTWTHLGSNPYEAQTLLGVNTGWHLTLVQTFTISDVFWDSWFWSAILVQVFFKSLRRIFLTMSTWKPRLRSKAIEETFCSEVPNLAESIPFSNRKFMARAVSVDPRCLFRNSGRVAAGPRWPLLRCGYFT
jgi:hypothetical protein